MSKTEHKVLRQRTILAIIVGIIGMDHISLMRFDGSMLWMNCCGSNVMNSLWWTRCYRLHVIDQMVSNRWCEPDVMGQSYGTDVMYQMLCIDCDESNDMGQWYGSVVSIIGWIDVMDQCRGSTSCASMFRIWCRRPSQCTWPRTLYTYKTRMYTSLHVAYGCVMVGYFVWAIRINNHS